MERAHLEHEFARKPAPQSVRLIDFDRAEVHPGFLPGTYILIVSGTKPYVTMQVTSEPLSVRQTAGVLGHRGARLPARYGASGTGTLHGLLAAWGYYREHRD